MTDKNGNTIEDDEKKKERWKEYFANSTMFKLQLIRSIQDELLATNEEEMPAPPYLREF